MALLSLDQRGRMLNYRSGSAILLLCWFLVGACNPSAALAASASELISNYRVSKGLGRVTTDSALNGIAQEQATAMAAKDQLEHDAAGAFSSRIAPSRAGRAAENIAYGHDNFPKTLDQWINSSGHRKNLLMPSASRVGVASAKSAKTGRTYWAMVIAGDYEQPKRTAAKAKAEPKARKQSRAPQACRLSFMGLCL